MDKIPCNKCGIPKELDESNFSRRGVGFRRVCRECMSELSKQKYQSNKEYIKSRADEYRKENKDKIISHMRDYNHRPEVIDRMKDYRANNRKSLRQKEKEWRKRNPEKARAIDKRKRIKYAKNAAVKLRHYVSRAVNFALNRRGSSKQGNSVMKYLPYTIGELKSHLESLFESWMNWENYGIYKAKDWEDDNILTWRWQIDHIVPQSDLPYSSMSDDNFQKCWSLCNLRPYNAKKNCLDGANRTRHKGNNAN